MMDEWQEYDTDYPMRWCLSTLAHNLSIAAALCHSYDLGANPPAVEPTKRIQLRTGIATIPGAVWRPGCGRSAP